MNNNPQYTIDHLLQLLEPLKKTAYLPIIQEANSSNSLQSKFLGYTHLEKWPICAVCGYDMPLILQLNLSKIPEQQQEGYMIRLFHCITNDAAGSPCCIREYTKDINEKFFSLQKSTLSTYNNNTLIPPLNIHAGEYTQLAFKKFSTEYIIAGWNAIDDYPSEADFGDEREYYIELLGEEKFEEIIKIYNMYDLHKLLGNHSNWLKIENLNHKKNKLFGYPHAEQSSYNLPEKKQRLLFQLLSDDIAPIHFYHNQTAKIIQNIEDPNSLELAMY